PPGTGPDAVARAGSNPAPSSSPTASQINNLQLPAGVNRPSQVVSDQVNIYDNPTQAASWPQPNGPFTGTGSPPTLGDVSEALAAVGYASNAFVYQTKGSVVYDSYGRAVDTYDPLGNKTHVAFTMNNGVTSSTTTTNALGQT